MKDTNTPSATWWVGLDVGSTTVKVSVVDPSSRSVAYSRYERHNADQAHLVYDMLADVRLRYGDDVRVAFCGSGGQPFAVATGAFFIQEVVANTLAIRESHPTAQVAIELGGQDAKVIFFRTEPASNQMLVSDMRMNGSCAGGTGAFIDQIAELLDITTEEFDDLARAGTTVYEISGRCGVFAKTDIQPLLNQGVRREDVALSSFHAIAKQTIGGLAQGLEVRGPVVFEGGPLCFNPTLIDVFRRRLALDDHEAIVPERPELMVAYGTALAVSTMYGDRESEFQMPASEEALRVATRPAGNGAEAKPFFAAPEEQAAFTTRHAPPPAPDRVYTPGERIPVYIGVDAGSTTTKFVVLDENDELLYRFYSGNLGDPLATLKRGLIEMRDHYRSLDVHLDVRGVGSTGYGERLFATALKTDYHTVETVAHAEAASRIDPNVSFVLDIGGQDMKAISIKGGIVTGIVLNEACSAGCGSFIETYARSLKIPIDTVASLAFTATQPSRLGSRCTVFMNSSIITEQKNGRTPADIMAGICGSIIENVFTKVVRVANIEDLGEHIVVQGGTFKNDAVLRAMEEYTGVQVTRAPYPGEMGAIGIAMLTRRHMGSVVAGNGAASSSFIGLDALDSFTYEKRPGQVCTFCPNNCNRTIVAFNDGTVHVTGNRCERGEIVGDIADPETRSRVKAAGKHLNEVPDMMRRHNALLVRDIGPTPLLPPRGVKIGFPRTLEFYRSLPFWHALFTSLGFEPVISRPSDYELFNDSLPSVPSDTVCFPAKLAHGHIRDLVRRGAQEIFFPMMIRIPREGPNKDYGNYTCAVVHGYPMVVQASDEPEARYGVKMHTPVFHWYDHTRKRSQTVEWLGTTYGIAADVARAAVTEAEKAEHAFEETMAREGEEILASVVKDNSFAVVLAGRPYHSDELVSHRASRHFTQLGIPVLTLDSLPGVFEQDLSSARMEAFNPFHARMLSAALVVSKHPNLELAQIVSFGCGHDAIISDEMGRIMREQGNKEMLTLKLDEGEADGPVSIRVRSFVETIRTRRARNEVHTHTAGGDPFPVKFDRQDKKDRTILIPNLSPSFSRLIASAIAGEGYRVHPMPLADSRAIALGKKYVHNDICYPAQINIGEALRVLESGQFETDKVALGISKNCEDCRAGHYVPLARKALDDAGYANVPIITTGSDAKGMHPGFRLSLGFQIKMVWGLALVDGIEVMVRAIRPYELEKGATDRVFEAALSGIIEGLRSGLRAGRRAFARAVEAFNAIPVDRSVRKPRCGILGEVLMNFHPVANGQVEAYLESHGMETVQATLSDFFRRVYLIERDKSKRNLVPNPFFTWLVSDVTERLFRVATGQVDRMMREFRFYEPHFDVHDLARNVEGMIDVSYLAGEGWLMPGEIIELARRGVNSFVILNPFACIPNHITGRGMVKPLKRLFPHIQILSLDYDPDTSFANIENRLQMLIIGARALESRATVTS